MTRAQFPAAEFFDLLQILAVCKPFPFPVVYGSFGSGLPLDNRTYQTSSPTPQSSIFLTAPLYFCTLSQTWHNYLHVELGGFGRGLLLGTHVIEIGSLRPPRNPPFVFADSLKMTAERFELPTF